MTGCATVYCGSASCVRRDVRCHVDLAQFHDEVSCIEALIGCQRDRARSVRVSLDHVERSQSLSMEKLDKQAKANDRSLSQEAELRLELSFKNDPVQAAVGGMDEKIDAIAEALGVKFSMTGKGRADFHRAGNVKKKGSGDE